MSWDSVLLPAEGSHPGSPRHSPGGCKMVVVLVVCGCFIIEWKLIAFVCWLCSVDAGFDEHDIPLDVIWLDIEHTDGKR